MIALRAAATATILTCATAIGAAQSAQPYASYFGKEDQQILSSSRIADGVVLRNVLQDIELSGYPPQIKEEMTRYTFERYRGAFLSIPQTPAAPDIMPPVVDQMPIPMVPATAPSVIPMHSYAPTVPYQTQTLENAGMALMQLGSMMAASRITPEPNKILIVRYGASSTTDKIFDDTIQTISAEKYKIRVADRSRDVIQAVKIACCDGTVYASIFVSIKSTGTDASINAVFARYPGVLGGGSPKKWAASFEKDMKSVEGNLTAKP